ncbi:MAG: hypothetical protein QG637_682, partial [Chloroflexota bacterium]|nr:hypothetical protein [Chloroflexota bacterium]
STLSGALPSFGKAQSKGAGVANGAPACFDCIRRTPPDSAQHASAL